MAVSAEGVEDVASKEGWAVVDGGSKGGGRHDHSRGGVIEVLVTKVDDDGGSVEARVVVEEGGFCG